MVFLYLLDSDTFLLVTVLAALGVLIQVWKAQRATRLTLGITFRRLRKWGKEPETEEEKEEQGSAVALAEASLEARSYISNHKLKECFPHAVDLPHLSLHKHLHRRPFRLRRQDAHYAPAERI